MAQVGDWVRSSESKRGRAGNETDQSITAGGEQVRVKVQITVEVGQEADWQDRFMTMDVTHSGSVNWDDYFMYSKYQSLSTVLQHKKQKDQERIAKQKGGDQSHGHDHAHDHGHDHGHVHKEGELTYEEYDKLLGYAGLLNMQKNFIKPLWLDNEFLDKRDVFDIIADPMSTGSKEDEMLSVDEWVAFTRFLKAASMLTPVRQQFVHFALSLEQYLAQVMPGMQAITRPRFNPEVTFKDMLAPGAEHVAFKKWCVFVSFWRLDPDYFYTVVKTPWMKARSAKRWSPLVDMGMMGMVAWSQLAPEDNPVLRVEAGELLFYRYLAIWEFHEKYHRRHGNFADVKTKHERQQYYEKQKDEYDNNKRKMPTLTSAMHNPHRSALMEVRELASCNEHSAAVEDKKRGVQRACNLEDAGKTFKKVCSPGFKEIETASQECEDAIDDWWSLFNSPLVKEDCQNTEEYHLAKGFKFYKQNGPPDCTVTQTARAYMTEDGRPVLKPNGVNGGRRGLKNWPALIPEPRPPIVKLNGRGVNLALTAEQSAWRKFLLFDINEDGEWGVDEYMAFATWRHMLAQDVKAMPGEEHFVTSVGWTDTIREGMLYFYEEPQETAEDQALTEGQTLPVEWKFKRIAAKNTEGKAAPLGYDAAWFENESVASYYFRVADTDNNKMLDAAEFAAFSFIMRYADKDVLYVKRKRMRELFQTEDEYNQPIGDCDHICLLFAIYRPAMVSMPEPHEPDNARYFYTPKYITSKSPTEQRAQQEITNIENKIAGNMLATAREYMIFHLWYVLNSVAQYPDGVDYKTEAGREDAKGQKRRYRQSESNPRVRCNSEWHLSFPDWVGIWWFAKLSGYYAHDGQYDKTCANLANNVNLRWANFEGLFGETEKDQCPPPKEQTAKGTKNSLAEIGRTRDVVFDDFVTNVVNTDTAHVFYSFLRRTKTRDGVDVIDFSWAKEELKKMEVDKDGQSIGPVHGVDRMANAITNWNPEMVTQMKEQPNHAGKIVGKNTTDHFQVVVGLFENLVKSGDRGADVVPMKAWPGTNLESQRVMEDLNVANVIVRDCMPQRNEMERLLFILLNGPKPRPREIQGLVRWNQFRYLVRYLSMGQGLLPFFEEDWKKYYNANPGKTIMVEDGVSPARQPEVEMVFGNDKKQPRTVSDFIDFMVLQVDSQGGWAYRPGFDVDLDHKFMDKQVVVGKPHLASASIRYNRNHQRAFNAGASAALPLIGMQVADMATRLAPGSTFAKASFGLNLIPGKFIWEPRPPHFDLYKPKPPLPGARTGTVKDKPKSTVKPDPLDTTTVHSATSYTTGTESEVMQDMPSGIKVVNDRESTTHM
jgi:hypothetical protein